MAKKKAIINLTQRDIEFSLLKVDYKVLSFNPNKMTLDVIPTENGAKLKKLELPFAHAPKEIKKLIKPN